VKGRIAEQTSENGKVKVVECDSDQWEFIYSVKYEVEWDRVNRSGVELLQNGWDLITKGEQS